MTIIGWFTYLGVPFGIMMVLLGMSQLAGDAGTGIVSIVMGVLAAALSAVAGSAFMNGREWVRRCYLWITPAVLGVEIAIGDSGVIQPEMALWRSVVGLSVYAAIAFALTRPRTKAFFGPSKRREVMSA